VYTQAQIYHTSKEWLDYHESSPKTQLVNFWTVFLQASGIGLHRWICLLSGETRSGNREGVADIWNCKRCADAGGNDTPSSRSSRYPRCRGRDGDWICIELGNPRFFSEGSWVFLRDLDMSDAITTTKIDRFRAEDITRRLNSKAKT